MIDANERGRDGHIRKDTLGTETKVRSQRESLFDLFDLKFGNHPSSFRNEQMHKYLRYCIKFRGKL